MLLREFEIATIFPNRKRKRAGCPMFVKLARFRLRLGKLLRKKSNVK